ncbi:MAG: nicotinate-nucleotide--dimethylbenzimidazole phosphoribosyltransferase [Deltaproteobacteria bacterium]|nr:nicotinate-nucleotide--dimethylbenzimidazole phosphoribosyltransferase [Deltaproteobacteria bacterium]
MNLLDATLREIQPLDMSLVVRVQRRLNSLTKPHGSLGRLEVLALRCASISGSERPRVDNKVLFVCCGDHGVCTEGVSAYPREVTAQMVYNFLRGGAAISVLARQFGINVQVVDLGVDHEFAIDLPGLVSRKVARGTANFVRAAAMSSSQAVQAIEVGIAVASDAIREGAQLIGVGEMGIGNTTSATAMLSVLSGIDPETLTGQGTGIDAKGRKRKVAVIKRALAYHKLSSSDPLRVLTAVGGYEIAGIVGMCLAGAALQVPVVIDGFIATAAAWVACALHPAVKDRLIFAHLSAEQGHHHVLAALEVEPLLNLYMRLGEGTGAALGMSLVDSAVRILNEMATFDEAGVAKGECGK